MRTNREKKIPPAVAPASIPVAGVSFCLAFMGQSKKTGQQVRQLEAQERHDRCPVRSVQRCGESASIDAIRSSLRLNLPWIYSPEIRNEVSGLKLGDLRSSFARLVTLSSRPICKLADSRSLHRIGRTSF